MQEMTASDDRSIDDMHGTAIAQRRAIADSETLCAHVRRSSVCSLAHCRGKVPRFMSAHTHRTTRRRPSHMWRVVAMCFLTFTVYELFLSGTCGPELLGFPPDVAAHAEDLVDERDGNVFAGMSSSTDASTHDHSDEAGCSTEDCFCCCAHICVSGAYVVTVLDGAVTMVVAHHVSLPTSPHDGLFRPPRTL